jgi:hypothetical protein
LTVILGSAAVFLALSTVHDMWFQQSADINALLSDLKSILPSLHWELATVILVSSYVIGAVFFRQDPKKPDAASALYVWKHSRDDERNGLAVQAKKIPPTPTLNSNISESAAEPLAQDGAQVPELCARNIRNPDLDTQFPYLYLKCYLKARGLTHLISLVPWCPKKESTKGYRTKMFINILKIRLLSFYPHISRDIIRNEAHVRLATSVWYASTVLINISVAIIAVLLICKLFACNYLHIVAGDVVNAKHPSSKTNTEPKALPLSSGQVIVFVMAKKTTGSAHDGRSTSAVLGSAAAGNMNSKLFVSVSFILLLLFFCIAMKYHLRKCIHYMRVREVIYVLETAYAAEKMDGALSVFEELVNKKDGECKNCSHVQQKI